MSHTERFLPGRRRYLQWGLALAAGPAGLSACQPHQRTVARTLAEVAPQWSGVNVGRGHLLREPPDWAGAMPGPSHRVLVVGSGVAGLSTAWHLREGGITDVAVLELEDGAGGNARAHRLGGLPCPLGAHYLPVPDERNAVLQAFLAALGLCQREGGKTVWNERHLVHAPQERLFFQGRWLDGLMPSSDDDPELRRQLKVMHDRVEALRAGSRMPTFSAELPPQAAQLDRMPFSQWLAAQGIDHALLLHYLDYCCRDDYGSPLQAVSAWAGLHYFAARHGFAAPGMPAEREGVLTWPEGNAWLTQAMARPLAGQLHAGQVVRQARRTASGWEVLVHDARTGRWLRWTCAELVMATPLFVAERVLGAEAPQALLSVLPHMQWAPWLVSNLLLDGPLEDRAGAPPAWDNVLHDSPALGYVEAGHQSLSPAMGPKVITHYWALGAADAQQTLAQRRRLHGDDVNQWAGRVLTDLQAVHPDLGRKLQAMTLQRHGHAMAVPVPGLRTLPALQALQQGARRLHFAHSDLSGYSVFEEAFWHGWRVARQLAKA